MRLRSSLHAIVICLVIAACDDQLAVLPSSAEIESVGILAVQAKKPAAIAQLTRWAQDGLPVAQRELALAYAANIENWAQAVQWLQKAAAVGDREAQFELANALLSAKLGLKQDYVQAWALYEKAAAQGVGKASFMLARMARHGWGAPQSAEQSVHWLQEASRQKNAQAMYELSVAYAQGDGIPRNQMQSRYWLTMSAEYDYKIAMHALALELDGLGGKDSPFSQRSSQLMKEASDHRLMRWNTNL
jgi:TPR repeat protein